MLKKISWKTIGWISIIVFSGGLLAQKAFAFEGVQFDPENKIANATKLTTKSPVSITIATIQWALGMLGLVAVVMVLYGGATWMTAAGNEERIKKAKDILKAALIGLVVVLLSWAIVTFVVQKTRDVAG